IAQALVDETTSGLRLMPDIATSAALSAQTPSAEGMTLLIGPEGGLDDEEKALARRLGFVPVSLGPRVLRTETAAVVAVTACQLLWGDLSASLQSPD
ncbi:MAG: RsmE family RNA methyltransferase, partial [Gammaproteobacteria bacterium]